MSEINVAPMPREVWFKRGGARLFAVDSGSGRPILFLHGGLANHLAALRIVAPLIPKFRIVTPDVRGNGCSVDGGTLDWDQLADDVDALMRHLKMNRAVIGGVSSGSGVALRFALRCPEKVAGLVLVSPVYGGDETGLTEHQAATFRMMDALGRRAVVEGVGVMKPLFQGLPAEIRDKAMAMMESFDAASIAATTRFLASGMHPFVSRSELEAIAAPTLLVPGSDDLHPSTIAEIYAERIPNSEVFGGTNVAEAIGTFCERLQAW